MGSCESQGPVGVFAFGTERRDRVLSCDRTDNAAVKAVGFGCLGSHPQISPGPTHSEEPQSQAA